MSKIVSEKIRVRASPSGMPTNSKNLITRVAQTFETDGTDLNSSYAERVIANRDQNPLWNISENLKVV
jgi:hypothetical protein